MNRPRRSNPDGLPPCCYFKNGAFWYVKKRKWTRLGKERREALMEYARITSGAQGIGSFPAFCDQTHALLQTKWAANTTATYDQARKALNKIFSDFHPEQIRRKHVQMMMDAQIAHPRLANRNLGFLRLVMKRALGLEMIEHDPCISVRKHPVTHRGRLLTDGEYDAIYKHAGPRLQVIMDICYMTGQRIGDVLAIKYDDLTEHGINFVQQKTGSRLTVKWSPELRAVIDRAKSLTSEGKVATLPTGFLLRGEVAHKRAKPPRYTVILAQWVAACKAARVEDANLHDIRAKSATDSERLGIDPQALLGHRDARTTRDYIRDLNSPLVEGPNIRQRSNR
jgi:integrase